MPHYYSYDALGSAERLTDAEQVEETGYAYYAFGKLLDEFGSAVTNPFRFIGQLGYYFDKDLDEMHVRARDYHPSIIRWLSPDPVDLQQVTDMLFTTMHLHYYAAIAFPAHQAFDLGATYDGHYRYVHNSPTRLIDPTGLADDPSTAAAAALLFKKLLKKHGSTRVACFQLEKIASTAPATAAGKKLKEEALLAIAAYCCG